MDYWDPEVATLLGEPFQQAAAAAAEAADEGVLSGKKRPRSERKPELDISELLSVLGRGYRTTNR